MKSFTSRKLFLIVVLIFSSTLLLAANGNGGSQSFDTMIFLLFVMAAIILLMIIKAQVGALKGIFESRDLWSRKDENQNSKGGKAIGLITALVLSQNLVAQTGNSGPMISMTTEMYWILASFNILLLSIIVILYFMTKAVLNSNKSEEQDEPDAIATITANLTDAVPIEREGEILLDHDYDGIQELDNNLPPWWKYGFYATIVFAFVYLMYYHVFNIGDLQTEEYNKEVQAAEIEIAAYKANQVHVVNEDNLEALTELNRLEAGKKVFMVNCRVCHGEFGEGMVGPNFTDKYWKHGGGIKNIYNIIKVGVPDMGMIPWESQLSAAQILEVASFILTLEGTNPPNQKVQEGELWEE